MARASCSPWRWLACRSSSHKSGASSWDTVDWRNFADYSIVQLGLLLRRRLGLRRRLPPPAAWLERGNGGPGSLDRWPTGMHLSVGAGLSADPAGDPRSACRAVLARCATTAAGGGAGRDGGHAATDGSRALHGIQVRLRVGTEGCPDGIGPCARRRPRGSSRQSGRLAGRRLRDRCRTRLRCRSCLSLQQSPGGAGSAAPWLAGE